MQPMTFAEPAARAFSPFSRRYPQIAAALAFVVLLALSWRRWTAPIADSGREMDLPRRLLEGEWLYRDVHYLYPPLAPYFNALLYRLFGVHLDVLHASGVFCSLALVWLSYRIARRVLAERDAAWATLAVIVLCVFKPNGNLIAPYAFAALYGVVFALGTLLLTLRYAERQRLAELLGAGVLIGLAAITKQEFALAGALTVTAAVVFLHRRDWRKLLGHLIVAGLPALLLTVAVYAWLFRRIGWQTLVEDCHLFYTHLPASLVFYNAQRTGFDHPVLSLAQVLGAAAVGVAALSGVVLLSARTRSFWLRAGLVLLGSFAGIALIKLIVGKQWDGSPLRALPLLLVALLVIAWRQRERDRETTALFVIAAYSLAILARVALRVPSGGAFGSFFLPTSLILFWYLFVRLLPRLVERWLEDGATAHRAGRVGQGLLLFTIIVSAIVFGVRYRRNFTHEIVAPRGHLYAPKVTGKELQEALAFISAQTAPGEAIAVLPEGSDLAFLTGRRILFRHQILIPGLMNVADEQAAIAALPRIRYVLIVNRPMREFGVEAFGRDFYSGLGQAIERQYEVLKVCGDTTLADPQIGAPQFFIKILHRRPDALPVRPATQSP